MPTKQRAERGGTDRAEDNCRAAVTAVVAYGPTGWRVSNLRLGPAYNSDAAVRWDVAENRLELIEAGALALIRGRLFFMEPMFSDTLVRIAQRRAARRQHARLLGAQVEADAVATHIASASATSSTSSGPNRSAAAASGADNCIGVVTVPPE